MNKWKRVKLLIILLLVFSTFGFSQGVWKHSGAVEFPMPVEDICLFGSTDRTIHAIVRNGDVLEHWTRGSKSPFPWVKQAVIPGKYKGSGTILLYADGNYLIGWPLVTGSGQPGEMETWWSRPDEWPDPSNPNPQPDIEIEICLENNSPRKAKDDCPTVEVRTFPANTILETCGLDHTTIPPPKSLSVSNGKLHYGDEPIILVGASCRIALWKGNPDYPDYDPWPEGYSLEKYEDKIIDSDINYVRHLGIEDFDSLYAHCQKMKDIIVEIEVYDPELSSSPLVNIDRMGELALLGNVLFDVGNEFKSHESAIDIVIDLCQRLKAQGCIVGAGAWSGVEGQGYSEIFHDRYDGHDYETHHRHWVSSHWKRTLEYGKPVLFNELFNLGNLTLDKIETLMNQAVQAGCTGVQFYHFFGPPETQTFKEVLAIAGAIINKRRKPAWKDFLNS